MKLYIAADAIAKGLDPTAPYCALGPDGMFAVPAIADSVTISQHPLDSSELSETPKTQPETPDVTSISELEKAPNPNIIVEVDDPGLVLEIAKTAEPSVDETAAVVEAPIVVEVPTVVETPKVLPVKPSGRQPKAPKPVS